MCSERLDLVTWHGTELYEGVFLQENKYQNWYDLVCYRQQLFRTIQLGFEIHLQGWHIGLKIQG